MKNQTLHLGIPHPDALPLSRRDYGERGPLQTSCMTCIFHTARISDVDCAMFVNNRSVGKF